MLRTVALIALFGSASVAAAYQTDEIFCTHTYNIMTCAALTTSATCAANTKCVWDATEEQCGLNVADLTVLFTDFMSGSGALSDSTSGVACAAVTTKAACTTACAWSEEQDECIVSVATADAALTTASVPAGVRGFVAMQTTGATTCGPASPVTAANCADPNCVFKSKGTDSSCSVTPTYALGVMSEKCGTNGAASLATAQAAYVSSGANVAAPLMVVISALVGALAIFA